MFRHDLSHPGAPSRKTCHGRLFRALANKGAEGVPRVPRGPAHSANPAKAPDVGDRSARIGTKQPEPSVFEHSYAWRAFARAFPVRTSHVLVIAAGLPCALANPALAGVPPYTHVGTFFAPRGPWDVLPDGRVIGLQNEVVVVESAPGLGDYAPIGSIDQTLLPLFGGAFIRVSPDGSRLAIGDNGVSNSVLLVNTADLNTGGASPVAAVPATPNFDATWTSNAELFVSGFGAGPIVSRVDAVGLTSTVVIDNVAASAGGVVSDGTRLYVGAGFDFAPGGGDTGLVRTFDLASLGGAPVDFDTGLAVADALSASPLAFDVFGNLLIGGGDFFAGSGDAGYAAVVDVDAILAALAGGPIAPDSAELRLSPFGPDMFYAITFNRVTNELLVSDGTMIARYAVPAPAAAGAFLLGGLMAARRRRSV